MSGIEPRLVGVSIRSLPIGTSGKSVVAIGIPPSFNRPHRVKACKSERWTIRHNRDTIDMTYAEIRSAFIDGANVQSRVRNIQSQCCQNIRLNGGIRGAGVLVIQVIPLFPEFNMLDVQKASSSRASFFPPGFKGEDYFSRPNFEGFRSEVPLNPQNSFQHWWGWCQLYRDGTVEGVTGNYVSLSGQDGDQGRRLIINNSQLESDLFVTIEAYIAGLTRLDFNPPYAVAASLLGFANSFMSHQTRDISPNSPSLCLNQ